MVHFQIRLPVVRQLSVLTPAKIAKWRIEYNEFRPYSSLCDQTPQQFAEQFNNNLDGQKSTLMTGTDFG